MSLETKTLSPSAQTGLSEVLATATELPAPPTVPTVIAPNLSLVPAAQPPPPQTVTIPLDQLHAFTSMQARLAKVEEDQQRRAAEARAEQVKVLAAKGQVEEALHAQREQAERPPVRTSHAHPKRGPSYSAMPSMVSLPVPSEANP